MKSKLNILFASLLLLWAGSLSAQNPQNVFNEDIQWINPLPQGLDIIRVRPFGTHSLLAVGDAGTIIRSNDNGQTWAYLKYPIYVDFYSMYFLDSTRVYVVGSGQSGATYVYYSDDGAQSFTQRAFLPNPAMRDIFFVNDTVGYMCGTVGRISKTTDGGFTWNTISTGVAQAYTSIYFLNQDTGFAGSNGTGLRRTIDGGATWSVVPGYTLTDSYRVGFVNDTIGYVTTYGNRISRTINGGLNWVTVFNPGLSDFNYDFYMLNKDTGIAVAGSYVYRTTNGTSWTGPFVLTGNLRSCAITKSGTAVVVGNYGQIRTDTTMPYSSFNFYDAQSTGDFYNRIEFFDANTGFICTDYGFIYKTTNGGLTWTAYRDTNLFADSFIDMAVLGSSKIAVVNFDGDILVSSNNGTTFSITNVNGTDPMYAIDFPSANIGFAVGDNGKVMKTINGGSTWVNQNNFPSASTVLPLRDVSFPTNATGYIGGNGSSIYKTTNGGATWTTTDINGLWQIQQIFFYDVDTGWAIDNNGYVAKTTNGGANWTITDTIGLNLQTNDLKFFDANFGIASGASNAQSSVNYSLTRDGGQTWTNYVFYVNQALKGVHMVDTSRIFFVGGNSSIIVTGDSLLVTSQEARQNTGEVSWKLFPNPAQDKLMVSGLHAGNKEWFITDLQGNIVLKQIPAGNGIVQEINLERLSAGVYIIHACDENGIYSAQKFVRK